jgi:hypothetical protein
MQMWTGLVCLVADPSCKEFRRFGDDGKGAYVNIVAWAASGQEFEDRVRVISADLDCIVIEIDNVTSLDARMEEPDYPEELITMRTTAERQPRDVIFGTFHIWTQSHIQ